MSATPPESSAGSGSATPAAGIIEVTDKDLPLHCPMARTPVWSYHPRVFLQFAPVAGSGAPTVKCPYCGTVYAFKGTALPKH